MMESERELSDAEMQIGARVASNFARSLVNRRGLMLG
jgi:hypothetical protein